LQKSSPPTHLVRSQTGDFLRGRIVHMDDTSLHIEIRLETKEIPRDRIAQIIWFHEDELLGEPPAAPDEPAEQPPGTRVQALRSDGIRLTFAAHKHADLMLAGTSDVLGSCRVDVRQVDQLLIGSAIEQAAAELAYNQWKLHYAIEPKIAQDIPGGGDGGTPGIESDLVGKPAPDFELPLLEGDKFHLANARGQIVVLDFWATWCGPCMQSMPLVEEVASEFRDQGVKLIAVNLEETANQIKGTLDRHKLTPTVAMDRDGVVSAKYQVSAIPQTVIIDREGKVARLYIGGCPKLAEQLREALNALLTPGEEKSKE
jgi:thiol-disulfide isomerase/thioredoxin